MSALSLEPLSAEIDWQFERALSVAAWGELFNCYLERLARTSAAQNDAVIGHIKGFVKLPEGGFIQVSVVSPALPASGMVEENRASSYAALTLTLIFLVYGLPYQVSMRIVEQVAYEIAREKNGCVNFTKFSDPKHTSHQHD